MFVCIGFEINWKVYVYVRAKKVYYIIIRKAISNRAENRKDSPQKDTIRHNTPYLVL